jgi:hypothetical protein
MLLLVATKSISEAGAVGLIPARVGRALSSAIAGIAWNLAVALASHGWLLPTSSSGRWTCEQPYLVTTSG